ncbi:hypothetical protein SEA_OHMYWARD_54 [Gordonia phage OhMyWard]|uniref:Uncharacterized protein n=1 Tax=Gordonia phage OhMyWard TaxID=2652414 RepID=A0A5P8D7F2_9CAUD|nr:hypothetical protein HWC72_gp54 [Gordonia phage OhMyWard]QFP94936.1 hypothetical protein SEA_OHMYWARD_54 [Gordonia phage OhMyWard]
MIASSETSITFVERLKNHAKTNKKTYIVGGVCLAAGLVGGAVIVRTSMDPPIKVQPKITQVLSWKPEAHLEVYIEALGDPGNIIQDTTTGTIYASQGQAAKALDTTKSAITRHLKGDTDFVAGSHKLVKLGKAHVSDIA